MSLTYSTYVSQMMNLMVVQYSSDPNFSTFLPGCIDYAEQRIYRELDLLATRVTSTGSFAANTRTFAYPVTNGSYVVVEEINAITPVGATVSSGTRNPLQPVSQQFLDFVYPSNVSGTGVPLYFFPYTSTACMIGPVPDQAYDVEVVGTIRPTPLSSTNTTTFLTNYLPDLFIAASMVFGSGYMRNFGSQSDNPAQAQSWENQYQILKGSAATEEARKKYQSLAWQSELPMPNTPARV